MTRIFYSLMFYLLSPLVLLRVNWRARQEPRYLEDLGQRFGKFKTSPGRIWVHAVSAGETNAAITLVQRLLASGEGILLTNMTPAGRERAEALFGNSPEVDIAYAPYDLPHAVNRFLTGTRPKALVIIDTELWPNILAQTKQAGIPVFLVNGRLSEKSATGYGKVSWLAKPMFAAITQVFSQSQTQSERFTELGAPEVLTSGSIKFDAKLPPDFDARLLELKEKFQGRKILLGASTHSGEETVLLKAYEEIRANDQFLIIAPRHIHRLEEVVQEVKRFGFVSQRHSDGAALRSDTDVYVVDTMGELIYFYGLCHCAFVGGSLIDRGGHNPMEPGMLGKPMMMGRYRRNIADIAELFELKGALHGVESAEDVVAFWQRSLDQEAYQGMSKAAGQVMADNAGALDRVVESLSKALKKTDME